MQDRRVDPERLRDLLIKNRLTNKAFAQRMGLSESMIQAVLAGTRQFGDEKDGDIGSAQRAAQVLGCAVEDFTKPRDTAA